MTTRDLMVEPEMDRKWIAVAKRRLAELRSGHVKAIPGEEVFARIHMRLRREPEYWKDRLGDGRGTTPTERDEL